MTSEQRAAFWLGYSGVIPFVGLMLGAAFLDGDLAQQCAAGLLIYEAVILSFLGGVIWGRAIADMRDGDMLPVLIVSVMPSLLAWIGVWIGSTTGMILCALGLLAVLAYDLSVKALPGWFRTLRLHLTVWAAGSTLLLAVLTLSGAISGA